MLDHGLVALGDSITYGEGGIVCGVDGRSWALWLAQVLDAPYVNYAVPGAVVADVRAQQLLRVQRDYDLGLLYAGVNDVRGLDFDLAAFDADLGAVLDGLQERCRHLLVLTIPLDLGRPPAGGKVADANAAIRAQAQRVGARLCALDDLAGWRHVLPDAVHPTALGQLEIADRAARVLGAPVKPSSLAAPRTARRSLARFAMTWGWLAVKDAARRRREALR